MAFSYSHIGILTIALLIEFDGTAYSGWQIQPNAITIQEILEGALARAYGVSVNVVGAGRTDAGVHARGQVANANIDEQANALPSDKIANAINAYLPLDIRIRDARVVDDAFHARFSAVWREYVYNIARERSVFDQRFAWYPELPYDAGLLGDAAREFVGKRDFTTFSKLNPDTPKYVCDVQTCMVETHPDRLVVRIRADRFVYGMCRSIVGAMMAVARKKCDVSDIAPAFEAADRSKQFVLAPAHGLVLNKIGYPDELFAEHTSF